MFEKQKDNSASEIEKQKIAKSETEKPKHFWSRSQKGSTTLSKPTPPMVRWLPRAKTRWRTARALQKRKVLKDDLFAPAGGALSLPPRPRQAAAAPQRGSTEMTPA